MPLSTDTIVAPATPLGTSALAVIRVSGPAVPQLAVAALGEPSLAVRHATRRTYTALSGQCLDDLVATLFLEPNSYTGEHLLELSTHGNPLIVHQVVADLLARGCRSAEPGEFTRRAFLHGRMDLIQAEAVMDLIHARSDRALAAAQQQLKGSLGRHLAQLTDGLIGLLARVEAYIDFPEEDLPPEDQTLVGTGVQDVLRGTQRLLATHHYGDVLRLGLRTVLLGAPNVGKSSLLNALLGRERALVSAEPGTTRDYLEETLAFGSHAIRLIDTAGLHRHPGAVERMGINKTLERAAEADLHLLVVDVGGTTPPDLPNELLRRLDETNTLLVLNKCDLAPDALAPSPLSRFPLFRTSATRGDGIEALRAAIAARADQFQQPFGEDIIGINARHAAALQQAISALQTADDHLARHLPVELLSSHLRAALDALGEISGRIDHEQVLDRLFSTFCIGK